MEDIDNATAAHPITQQRARGVSIRPLGGFIRRLIRTIRSRRELARMDDRMWADIGVSRGEALMESRRPAWDMETPPDATRRSRGR
ncbi:MAG: DUF1127 domain-containing protein [Proteobacteria bacterium]|nr:DUF1127 domain-containing protein [Pseudomonadota bacterium]